nr:hypothetical protein [Lysobacter spongiae]
MVFALAASVVWRAGIVLSRSTDRLDRRFGWGQAVGGMVLLAIVTNLPEIAIVASASLQGRIEVAVGNLLGGVAIQTLVLVVLDAASRREEAPLARLADSPQLRLEAALVVVMLGIVILGRRWDSAPFARGLTAAEVLLALAWLGALLAMRFLPVATPPQAGVAGPDAPGADAVGVENPESSAGPGTARTLFHFAFASLATLVAGVGLELCGDAIAGRIGMDGVVFAATVLAAATALPEVSSGLESIRMRRWQLAMSDIFGGNAFLPILLVLATVLAGTPVLGSLGDSDAYLAGLGVILTVAYLVGMRSGPRRRFAGLGLDSWTVLLAYIAGIGALALGLGS